MSLCWLVEQGYCWEEVGSCACVRCLLCAGLLHNELYIACVIGTPDAMVEAVPCDALSHDTFEAVFLSPRCAAPRAALIVLPCCPVGVPGCGLLACYSAVGRKSLSKNMLSVAK